MQDRLNWQDLRVLLAFGRHGSLTRAAQVLRIDETTAARNLKRLEHALGVALLSRDGQKIRLTDAGHLAFERAKVMETAAASLSGGAPHTASRVSGPVKLTSLRFIFDQVVIPAMPALLRAHPGLTPKLLSGNRNLRLDLGEADIAIRLGPSSVENLHAVQIGQLGYAAYRPRNRFANVTMARCPWVAFDHSMQSTADATWVAENIAEQRIVLRANALTSLVAAVKSGMASALLPVIWGDNDPDMVRMQDDVCLRRDLWLLTRLDQDMSSAVGETARWIEHLFADLAAALAG